MTVELDARERELKEVEDELRRTLQEIRENYEKLGVALAGLEREIERELAE
tara:strand:- start:364 stop:516 length:153 start_codon:yes stop_codon:yes gene_type:complete